MGGEPDGGGCVDASTLIRTIKEEFQMTIDIEKLIEEVDEDGSGEIEFDEFKALLQSEDTWKLNIKSLIHLYYNPIIKMFKELFNLINSPLKFLW